jgi:hypothetical protein
LNHFNLMFTKEHKHQFIVYFQTPSNKIQNVVQ